MLKKLLKPFVRSAVLLLTGMFQIWFHTYIFIIMVCRRKPRHVTSILHVSVMSHKPMMLVKLMKKKGLKTAYMAVEGETGWLKLGPKGYDYNFSLRKVPYMLRPLVTFSYIWFVMRQFDVIHYHFNSLLSADGKELPYLKKMGKVIVFHFRGCELRQKSVNNRLNPELNCCQECCYPVGTCDTEYQRKRIEIARHYADMLFVTTPDLKDFLPEAECIPFIAPYGIDLQTIKPTSKKPGIFRIVTSSNHDGVDGTSHIRSAINKLQKEGYALELFEVRKTPYEEALSIYKSADIYVGKLRMGYYNNAIIECLLLDIPTMCFIRDEFLATIPDCPIIVTRPDNVYRKIKNCLEDPSQLTRLKGKGPAFIHKYHNTNKLTELLIDKYNAALITAAQRRNA